jgi:HPt (histidine-containing phosphotransfer) domain-containing protein
LVWEHQQDRVSDRIGTIERAVAELADDRLDPDLRGEAERAAHMLAGSLGMFGFIAAADAARRLERELAQPTIDRAPALSGLLARLRAGVQGPVVLCGRHPDDEAHEGSR